MKIIDLSVPISPRIREPLPAKIEYASHEAGHSKLRRYLGLSRRIFRKAKRGRRKR